MPTTSSHLIVTPLQQNASSGQTGLSRIKKLRTMRLASKMTLNGGIKRRSKGWSYTAGKAIAGTSGISGTIPGSSRHISSTSTCNKKTIIQYRTTIFLITKKQDHYENTSTPIPFCTCSHFDTCSTSCRTGL